MEISQIELSSRPQLNDPDPNNANSSNPESNAAKIRSISAFALLIMANVINCMEIYSLVGVVSQVRIYFDLNYTRVSLSQCMLTVGITTAYPFLTLLEYGNRRKTIVVVGSMIRSVSSISSSFFGPNDYPGFLWLRLVSGFGIATVLILGPKLIEASLTGLKKSITLSLFYLTIPIGGGLGMMVGPLSTLIGNWKWGLRILPIGGIALCIPLAILMVEPKRTLESAELKAMDTPYKDIRHLFFHKTYMLTTLAFMCVLFVTGSLNVWGIFFMHRFGLLRNSTLSFQLVGIIFGSSTASSGMVGMVLALTVGAQFRAISARAEIFLSGIAMMIGGPIFLLFTLEDSNYKKWGLLFLCMVCLYMTRPLLSDIMMNIILPSHIKLAWSFQQIISHLLGDAIGAVLVGMSMDEMLVNMKGKLEEIEYISLQASLYTVSFGFIISAAFYFIGAVFYKSIRKKNSI